MGNELRGERISDGLNANIKQSTKLWRLTQKTYKEIVKMFENPINIKQAEEQIAKVLKMEKDEMNAQRSKNFAEWFNKPVKMPKTVKIKQHKRAA